MQRIRPLLVEAGVPSGEAQQWTSHCFRRGSGVDTLEEHGVAAMVSHGEWSCPRAAEPYASVDEQRAVAMSAAMHVVDESDDDL